MAFELRFKKTVLKDFQILPKIDQERLLKAMQKSLGPDPYQGKALTGEFTPYQSVGDPCDGVQHFRTFHIS